MRPALAPAPGWRAALLLGSVLAGLAAPGLAPRPAAAAGPAATPAAPPPSKTDPVFYQADTTSYDRDGGFVTLTGHVEMWQGDRVLRADSVTYDRSTGVASAKGHVVMLDPTGQVVFADYAELRDGMKNGVLTNMRAQLPDNGRIAANGARRTEAEINELSRAVYSTCNICLQHPEDAPLWQLRARSAVQDVADQRIEYRDAVLDIYGVPVMWFPYLTHPDPTAKRQSGFMVPTIGYTKYLGAYTEVPYYWAIDASSDATITPLLATGNGPGVIGQYRQKFNDGTITLNGSMARDANSFGYDIDATGQFAIDTEWRWGFDINRASSVNYFRDLHLPGDAPILTSQVYTEGFGQGAYARLDVRAYQGLSSSVVASRLPYVLPRYEYSFVGEPDALGGRLSLDAGAFNVARQQGTNTQRADLQLDWERPAIGALGDVWKLQAHVDSAVYAAHQLDQNPTWGPQNVASAAQGMPTMALNFRWPLERDGGSWGTQVIEPIIQLIAAPRGNSYGLKTVNGLTYVNTLVPNEDSLDFDFTDSNLFSLNRFPGVDRLEGGTRANVALHGAWYFADGEQLDAQVGQGYRTNPEPAFPVGSGLEGTVTDIVSHLDYAPGKWVDFETQQRFDHDNLRLRFLDAVAGAGPDWLRVNAGYLYSSYNPYLYYDTLPTGVLPTVPRKEISLGASAHYGPWKISGGVRRDLELNKMVTSSLGASYENECFVFDVRYFHRYASLGGDTGVSSLLFELTFKTVGSIGFNGL